MVYQLHAPDDAVRLDLHSKPEFDDWHWVSYYPIKQVADFKQDVYRRALAELAQYLPKGRRAANESANYRYRSVRLHLTLMCCEKLFRT